MNTDDVKTYQPYSFRLYPTKAQETALGTTLATLRLVYNSLLNERKFVYETTGKGISQYAQEKHFAEWRKQFHELTGVHSHLLQNAALRVNLAYAGFFRRVKSGDTAGFPRSKGIGQYDSFCFKEWGNGISFKKGNLSISKIGEIKCRLHRPLTCIARSPVHRRRLVSGAWRASGSSASPAKSCQNC